MNLIEVNGSQKLNLITKRGNKIIPLKSIEYIQAFRKGSVLYLKDSEIVETNYLLRHFLDHLFPPVFFRCHHSFVINCKLIDCYCKDEVILNGNKRIPLSRSKRKEFIINLLELE